MSWHTWKWLTCMMVVVFGMAITQTGCQPADSGGDADQAAEQGDADEDGEEMDEHADHDHAAGEHADEEGDDDEDDEEDEDEGDDDDEGDDEEDEDEGDDDDQAAAVMSGPEAGTPLVVNVPLGLPELPVPADNPMTVEKVELGKMLYFDKRLSKDGAIACATCHDPKMAWAEDKPTSTGIDGQVGGANSPTVINAAYAKAQFWDGRAASLEEQALGPIENPIEMGHTLKEMVPQLDALTGYNERFQKVFGTGVTSEGIAKSIAAFERTVLSGNSPYDKFKAGDDNALTEVQKKGMNLFEDAGCSTCHVPPMFSNYGYFNTGVGQDKSPPDPGRKNVTGRDGDVGKYRVPSLREVAKTGPYFHDGSGKTLEDAVALMAGGGIDNDNLTPMIKAMREAKLIEEDRAAIVEFLKALSGDYPVIEPPEMP